MLCREGPNPPGSFESQRIMSLPSEPWITLQLADLNDYLVGAQASAVTTAALASGQSNTWTNIMTDVVNEIRSAIRGGCLKNLSPVVVSQTPLSIPPDLKSAAMWRIVITLQRRIPQLKLTQDQKDAAKEALDKINDVRDGKVVITMPPDPLCPDDQQRAAPVTVVHADRKRATARDLRGL